MREIWKPAPGYEGRYEVSSRGRIRCISRNTKLSAAKVDAIRKALKLGGSPTRLARKYDVSRRTIYDIKSGKTWGRVSDRRERKVSHNDHGYIVVSLPRSGKWRPVRVHRLEAGAFLGPCPPKMEVNHINGVKDDNRIENLEYVTKAEQMIHARRVLKHMGGTSKGEANGNARLRADEVAQIKAWLGIGQKAWVIGFAFGVSKNTIYDIAQGKTWKAVSAAKVA